MANIVVVVVLVVVVWYVISTIQRRRRGLVAERGTSIGADLGALSDQPRMRVRSVAMDGADRAHLVLTPEEASSDADLDLVVFLREADIGFELLQDWERHDSVLGVVMLPGGELVRLRSFDDLQPLTLRRVSDG